MKVYAREYHTQYLRRFYVVGRFAGNGVAAVFVELDYTNFDLDKGWRIARRDRLKFEIATMLVVAWNPT